MSTAAADVNLLAQNSTGLLSVRSYISLLFLL